MQLQVCMYYKSVKLTAHSSSITKSHRARSLGYHNQVMACNQDHALDIICRERALFGDGVEQESGLRS